MEQADTGKGHHHVVLVAAIDDGIIPDGTAGLRNVFDAALFRSLDIVREREEGIGYQGHILNLVKPCPFFLASEHWGLYFKGLFPHAVRQYIHVFLSHIHIDGIVPIGPA